MSKIFQFTVTLSKYGRQIDCYGLFSHALTAAHAFQPNPLALQLDMDSRLCVDSVHVCLTPWCVMVVLALEIRANAGMITVLSCLRRL